MDTFTAITTPVVLYQVYSFYGYGSNSKLERTTTTTHRLLSPHCYFAAADVVDESGRLMATG